MPTIDQQRLLALSTAAALVRDPSALSHLLAQHAQPLLGFAAATVMVSPAQQPPRQLVTAAAPGQTNPFAKPSKARQTLEAELYPWLLRQSPSHVTALTELQAAAPSYPGVRALRAAQLTISNGVVLRRGELPIGYLWLHYGANQVVKPAGLLLAVAELLALAVANVLVQEQVEQVQRQLVPGIVGGAPRPREQLAQLVIAAFRQLLPFDASCLVAYDEKMGYDWFYLGDLPPVVTEDEAVRAYYPQLGPRPDLAAYAASHAQWMTEPAIVLGNRSQLERIGERGYPVLRAALGAGLQESLFLHLRLGDQPVGSLFLYAFQAGHFAPYAPLFDHLEHLLEPVALGVSHGLAYEALRAADQEKTFQLAVGRALSRSSDQRQLFAAVAHELAAVVPWDRLHVLGAGTRQPVLALERDPTGHIQAADGLEQLRDAANLDGVSFNREWRALGEVVHQTGVYSGADFLALAKRVYLVQVASRLHGLRSALYLPLPAAGGQALALTMESHHPYGLTQAHLELLQRLLPQIGLALQNQAAYAEIVALKQQLEAEKTYLVEEIKTTHNFDEIVGRSTALEHVFRSVDQVAATDTTVLILGETGTGKELIARALHHGSPRRARVLVKVNCASLPAQLIESELFGHEKGAFTGAAERRIGKFELANGGTIFLDEIGELPLELQAKLLRVLQEREIERVGGSQVIAVDVRILAATNRVLAEEVAAGRFRADLFYRLNVFPIALPPLRERPDDIPLLAAHFGQKFARRLGRPFLGIADGCLQQLHAYSWPGNVRELENVIERAVIISRGEVLQCQLPLLTTYSPAPNSAPPVPAALTLTEMRAEQDQHERARIEAVLLETHWRIRGARGAAAVLHMKPTTLEARMRRLGIHN